MIDGLGVGDIDFVAAFATSEEKSVRISPRRLPGAQQLSPARLRASPVGCIGPAGLIDATEVERVAGGWPGPRWCCTRRRAAGRTRRRPTPRRLCRRGRRSSTPPPTRWPAIRSCWTVRRCRAAAAGRRPGQPVRHVGRAPRPAAAAGGTGTHPGQLLPGQPGGTEDFRNLVENRNTKLSPSSTPCRAGARTGYRSLRSVPAASGVAEGGAHQP